MYHMLRAISDETVITSFGLTKNLVKQTTGLVLYLLVDTPDGLLSSGRNKFHYQALNIAMTAMDVVSFRDQRENLWSPNEMLLIQAEHFIFL